MFTLSFALSLTTWYPKQHHAQYNPQPQTEHHHGLFSVLRNQWLGNNCMCLRSRLCHAMFFFFFCSFSALTQSLNLRQHAVHPRRVTDILSRFQCPLPVSTTQAEFQQHLWTGLKAKLLFFNCLILMPCLILECLCTRLRAVQLDSANSSHSLYCGVVFVYSLLLSVCPRVGRVLYSLCAESFNSHVRVDHNPFPTILSMTEG